MERVIDKVSFSTRRFASVFGLAVLAIAAAGCAHAPPPSIDVLAADVAAGCASRNLQEAFDSAYGRDLIAAVAHKVFYPEQALARGESGTVRLCVGIARDGSLVGVRVLQSSGHALLDGAALYAMGLAGSGLPEVPERIAWHQPRAWFDLPVNFVNADREVVNRAAPVTDCTATTSTEYRDRMMQAALRRLYYPDEALGSGHQGAAVIAFSATRDNRFEDARIARSSGIPLLDGVALLVFGQVELSPDRPCFPSDQEAAVTHFPQTLPLTWKLQQ